MMSWTSCEALLIVVDGTLGRQSQPIDFVPKRHASANPSSAHARRCRKSPGLDPYFVERSTSRPAGHRQGEVILNLEGGWEVQYRRPPARAHKPAGEFQCMTSTWQADRSAVRVCRCNRQRIAGPPALAVDEPPGTSRGGLLILAAAQGPPAGQRSARRESARFTWT